MDHENIHYGNISNMTSMFNQHKIFDIIDNVKYYFQKTEYALAMFYLEKNIPGFLECKSFIKFKLMKYQLYQHILYNQNEGKKFYEENMLEYIQKNFKNFQEKESFFNKIIQEPSLLLTRYVTERGYQNIEDFFQLLYREILNFVEGNVNITNACNEFLNFPENFIEYDSDFEREIVYQTNSSFKKHEKFRSIEQFQIFAQKDQSSDCFKFLKLTLENLPPNFQQLKSSKNNIKQSFPSQIINKTYFPTSVDLKHEKSQNEPKKMQIFQVIKPDQQDINIPKQKLPHSKRFNPKFTKRENLDKKIVRKFRKFLKESYWKQPQTFDICSNKEFWLKFVNEDVFPPSSFSYLGQNYHFKSFNTSYICWLFSQKNAECYFNIFIKEKGEVIYKSIVEKYWRKLNELSDNEKIEVEKHLQFYINRFADIFNPYNFEISAEYTEEHSESMPAVNPNTSGSFTEHLEKNYQEPDDNIIYKKE